MSNRKKSAPATAVAASAPAQSQDTPAQAPKLGRFYRVHKISGYLYQMLEVEVDENVIKPVPCEKPDMRDLVLDKMADYVCPHIDSKRHPNNQKKK